MALPHIVTPVLKDKAGIVTYCNSSLERDLMHNYSIVPSVL